jgi:type I restriction enzyme M protein
MNTDTKRHIDSARQVLVGVVPNPTSQIDQITNALIYKFMDDMDQASIKQGGEPAFFVGDLELFAWTRLMDSRIGNQERMNLYGEALIKFSQAKQLPELFRGIFKSAFLPYRSPETLGLFLKEIDYFDYSHPEELGNAYEYLLSIMSSQGDAGQFRTPRHIIDFIVDVVNPTKDDKVLDPACGTGGFLVSSYKHILEQHDSKDDPEKKEKPLTPDDRKKLMANFEGYDIDPTMVRIAQVNMYLHQFKNPKIFQYDSLSSEERWNDRFDVILANPPFMSPKGGIKPHSKFGIQSSRSEVLFVDYIINHLRPRGRAGIIVPEGIIFQSGTAYKQLRKNLVEEGLYAVASLPSGVFAPYSGVKTSILFFNNELAKTSREILFVKIEQDGFDLGAQRRVSIKNDLPQALTVLNKWNTGEKVENKLAVYVEKSKIGENGEYNLSVERYRIATDYTNAKWSMVKLEDVCDVYQPKTITSNEIKESGKYKVFGANGVIGYFDEYNHEESEVAVTCRGATCGTINFTEPRSWITGNAMVIKPKENNLNKRYLFFLLRSTDLSSVITGAAQPQITGSALKPFLIPLPPLEIQGQIVAELDGYTKIIEGAKQIVRNWKPKIDIDPAWEKVKLGEVCEIYGGGTPSRTEEKYWGGAIPWLSARYFSDDHRIKGSEMITELGLKNSSSKIAPKGSTILITRVSVGKFAIADQDYAINQDLTALESKGGNLDAKYLWLVSEIVAKKIKDNAVGVGVTGVTRDFVVNQEIPLPSHAVQKQIVEKIEAERAHVESANKLIAIYEQKTKEVISKLWQD